MQFSLIEELSELTPVQVGLFLVCAALVAAMIALLVTRRRKATPFNTQSLIYGALCIALSFTLSYIKLFQMPQGGSLTPASMLPIMIYSYWFGPRKGFVAAFAYSFLQYFQEPFFVHPVQFLLDYTLAFSALAIAGFFQKRFLVGVTVAGVVRTVCHVISGAVFFAEYAGDLNPWIYSIGYNFGVFTPDIIICVIVAALPQMRSLIQRLRPTGARPANPSAAQPATK